MEVGRISLQRDMGVEQALSAPPTWQLGITASDAHR